VIEEEEAILRKKKSEVWDKTRLALTRADFLNEHMDMSDREYEGEVIAVLGGAYSLHLLCVEVSGLFMVEFFKRDKSLKVGDWVRFRARLTKLEEDRKSGRRGRVPVLSGSVTGGLTTIRKPGT